MYQWLYFVWICNYSYSIYLSVWAKSSNDYLINGVELGAITCPLTGGDFKDNSSQPTTMIRCSKVRFSSYDISVASGSISCII